MKRGPVLLVDGNNMAMRAIYASRHSHMEAAGMNTGPLTTFMASFAKIVSEVDPVAVAIAWDGRTSMRHQLIAGYKANRSDPPDIRDLRRDSFLLIRQLLGKLNMGINDERIFDFEADDVIAAWWVRIMHSDATEIVIASSDKDFLQLLGPNPHGVETKVLRLSSAGTESDWWDAKRFEEVHGYSNVFWPQVMALAGDRADGVPGIPGIGPKRAQALLEEHEWNLVKALREKHPDYLFKIQDSLLAVNLRQQNQRAPVRMPLKPFNDTAKPSRELLDWLDHYGMIALKGKIVLGTLWSPARTPGRPLQLRLPLPEAGA
jgi:5'-3' exonuclease